MPFDKGRDFDEKPIKHQTLLHEAVVQQCQIAAKA
jgi:hypothetical protein